jgi:hypothetical protein
MNNETERYKKYVTAWQHASDRKDAHNRYNEITGHGTPYYLFMEKIRYMKREKGVKLKELDLLQADWDKIRKFAQTLQ